MPTDTALAGTAALEVAAKPQLAAVVGLTVSVGSRWKQDFVVPGGCLISIPNLPIKLLPAGKAAFHLHA